MKQIPLTQGKYAIVDDDMFEYINQWKWYANWCTHTKKKNGKQCTIRMARQILGLEYGDKRQGDHINHNTLNNRRSNLRVVTLQQNRWNRKNPKGYYFHKASEKYLAHIGLNGKRIHLGLFCTAKEAHNVYIRAKEKYHIIGD